MKKRESELIVKTVLAGIASKHAISDIDSRKQLRKYGIDRPQANQLEKRLLLALSGEKTPLDPERFHATLTITPASTVAAVAAQLPKSYKESQTADAASKPFKFKGDVEIAVHTALAQHSRKYSVWQIKPTMYLADLGLDQAGIAKAKISVYKTFSGPKSRIKFPEFASTFRAKKSSKVEDLVQLAMSLAGDDPTKLPG